MSTPSVSWFCEETAAYFLVERSVRRLLAGTPSDYLGNLDQIVLREAASLSGKERRRAASRNQRHGDVPSIVGRYHRAKGIEPAWIELFLDNVARGWPVWVLRIAPIADYVTAKTLYHEIGHHIHSTLAPDHRDREEAAEDWMRKLLRHYLRRRYFYLRPFAGLLRLLGRTLQRIGRWRSEGSRRS